VLITKQLKRLMVITRLGFNAKDFCMAAGKFLLSYEQHRLAASIRSVYVRSNYDWEWVLNSSGDDGWGQIGGFFGFNSYRLRGGGLLNLDPDYRGGIAFRCGVSPSPQDFK